MDCGTTLAPVLMLQMGIKGKPWVDSHKSMALMSVQVRATTDALLLNCRWDAERYLLCPCWGTLPAIVGLALGYPSSTSSSDLFTCKHCFSWHKWPYVWLYHVSFKWSWNVKEKRMLGTSVPFGFLPLRLDCLNSFPLILILFITLLNFSECSCTVFGVPKVNICSFH